MHTISNERALAHWRTLCTLPSHALDVLEDRFTREQPLLARAIAELTDAAEASREAWDNPGRDPRLSQFGKYLTRGVCLAELFRREAGRPLRPLDEAELNSILRATVQMAKALEESPKPDGPDFFATSDQPELLRGIVIGHLSVEGVSEKESKAVVIYHFLVQALHRACGDGPPDPSGDWAAERILVALCAQGDPLRRAALEAVESFRAEVTSHLIKELESWAADPEAALQEDGSLGLHALYLLAKWREDSAWPAFRKVFCLPSEVIFDLLGDLITEEASTLLAMVGGRRRDELRAMIEDESLDEYSRGACIDALTCLVAWGEMAREEHVAGLRELLTTTLRQVRANEYVFGRAVGAACDLEAGELRSEVEATYHRGVVDEGFIDLEYFLKAITDKNCGPWQAFRESHRPIADVAGATEWLDEPPGFPVPGAPDEEEPHLIADSDEPYIAPPKVGRNDPCPCGSGKKYKKCCGK